MHDAWQSRIRRGVTTLTFAFTVIITLPAAAGATVLQLSSDPFTQATCAETTTTNHHTEVEPDTAAHGSTIVTAFQVGRVYDGGACAIGFATSSNDGATWTNGLLPGITKYAGGGPNDRATDASIAYDAKYGVWLVSSLTLLDAGGVVGNSVVTSRSTDGVTWSAPVTTATATGSASFDKNWITCDNTSTSPHYGNCYTEFDNNGAGNLLQMTTSTDGGLTWSAPATNGDGVIGGQPVTEPNGNVVVPIDNANETAVGAFDSTNGGATWGPITTIALIRHHTVAGQLRESPLPSAAIDGAGTVYVAWADCRFRKGCKTNDLVLSHSLNATGTSWSAVTRVPIDSTNTGDDHFIPGLAVNPATSGSTAQLGLTYYYYPPRSSSLAVGFISSANAGSTWSSPQTLISGMPSTWTAPTSQGYMVGDYISTSFTSDGLAHGVFATASAPTSGTTCSQVLDNCNEPMDTFATGLAGSGTASGVNSPVLAGGSGGAGGNSLWNVVDNNGAKHRD